MFSTHWQTSKREFGVVAERNLEIPVGDGVTLKADVYRPDRPGRYPVLFTPSPYPNRK